MDERREKWLFAGYAASAVATCVLVELVPGTLLHRLMKAVPLLLLCVSRWQNRGGTMANFVGLGLFASLLGDAAIDTEFVAGLGAFLVGHIFYIIGMGIPRHDVKAWLAMLPALVFGSTMYSLLVGSGRAPKALHIPVTIYMLLISLMFGRALSRAFVEQKDSQSKIFLAGAIFFVTSDSLIGIRRWVYPFPHAAVTIMATYYAAQWLIYRGSMRRLRRQ